MIRKIAAGLVVLAMLCGMAALGEGYHIAEANTENFSALLSALWQAYDAPAPEDAQAIEAAVQAIGAVSAPDGEVARAIADHWSTVYLNAQGEYPLYLHDGGDLATALEGTSLRDCATHAFVVLGYELQNGEMTEELKGRCEAAAAAARSFPWAVLVCSGGPTGDNNPNQFTEAGRMRDYLIDPCGIDAARILTDERAMTTVDNAVNTLEILRAEGLHTMTLVTSAYHQRWAQVLYNAVAAMYRQVYDYRVDIVENYSFDIEPSRDAFRQDAKLALRQLSSLLGLPREEGPGPRK